jgi:hypothetical protein
MVRLSSMNGVPDHYEKAWKDLRRRRTVFVSMLVATAPIVYFVRQPPVFAWFFVVFGAAVWVQFFRCPRCGEEFAATWWWRNVFTRKCLHCGLHSGARPESRSDSVS